MCTYVRTYFGVRDCISVYVPYGKDQGVEKPAVYVAEILIYCKVGGQVSPLFEKKVLGIVDVQHHAFFYKDRRM